MPELVKQVHDFPGLQVRHLCKNKKNNKNNNDDDDGNNNNNDNNINNHNDDSNNNNHNADNDKRAQCGEKNAFMLQFAA